MKKYLFLSIVAATALTACNNEEVQTDRQLSQDEVNMEALAANPVYNSDVVLQLGGGNDGTRASILTEENNSFQTKKGKSIGIFCMAVKSMGINPTELPIDWTPSSKYSYPYSVWKENTPAWAEKVGTGTEEDPYKTNIHWYGDSIYYYPTGNWHQYAFYGYHPYTSTIKSTSTTREADFDIDCKTDILWGEAAKSEEYAYSAKYFRQYEHLNEIPNMEFKHRLMQLRFSVVAGRLPDYAGADILNYSESHIDSTVLNMRVKSVRILDIPTKCHMIIAERNETDWVTPNNMGVITGVDWTTKSGLKNFYLTDRDDKEIGWQTSAEAFADKDSTYLVTTTEKRIGDGFLFPAPTGDHKFQIEVVLEYKQKQADGTYKFITFYPEHPMDLLIPEGGFKAANSYNVKLTVNAPKEITMTATLVPWTDNDKFDEIVL